MLISLKSPLHPDIALLIQKFTLKIQSIGDRVHHIENKMEEFITTINYLADTHEDNMEDHIWLKAKKVPSIVA